MIDHLIHIYKKGAAPFQSLSALSDRDALRIMQDSYVEGAIFWDRFRDPDQYLRARRQVEQRLRQEFIAKGGAPQEPYPIYMILGRTRWLQTAADAATLATTAEIQVPLSLFRECDISFTLPLRSREQRRPAQYARSLVSGQRNGERFLPMSSGPAAR